MTNAKNIVIVGGGPVGLVTANMLLGEWSRLEVTTPIQIMIYDGRWRKNDDTQKVEWTTLRNNRRMQVVTIQSNVWSELPDFVQDKLFPQDERGETWAEYWPLGPDSPKEKGFPRNIPIRYIEDKLLYLLQDEDTLNKLGVHDDYKPQICIGKATEEELQRRFESGIDYLILADGGRSETEKILKKMKAIDDWAFPRTSMLRNNENGETLIDNVLGIFLDFREGGSNNMLTEKECMAITISQSRFLLNHLPGKFGFLNMWLSSDEAAEAVGVSTDANESPCTQAAPCTAFQLQEGTKSFKCPKTGKVFKPTTSKDSILWKTITGGLALLGIDKKYVKKFVRFQLGPYTELASFSADSRGYEKPFKVFIIGDAAVSVNFRFGRGLNTGIKGGISLTNSLITLIKKGRNSTREADFTKHHGYMSTLVHREVGIRTKIAMEASDIQTESGYTEGMGTRISILRNNFLFTSQVEKTLNGGAFNKDRLSKDLKLDGEGYKENIKKLDKLFVTNLLQSKSWPTRQVGGEEVPIYRIIKEVIIEVEHVEFNTKFEYDWLSKCIHIKVTYNNQMIADVRGGPFDGYKTLHDALMKKLEIASNQIVQYKISEGVMAKLKESCSSSRSRRKASLQ